MTAGAGPATPRRCANGASGTPTTSPRRTRGGARSTALSIRCRRARAWSATNHSRADRMRWFVARVAGVSESSSSDERGGWPNRSEAGRTHPPDGPSPWSPPPIRANRPGRSSASDDFFDRARAGAWFGLPFPVLVEAKTTVREGRDGRRAAAARGLAALVQLAVAELQSVALSRPNQEAEADGAAS